MIEKADRERKHRRDSWEETCSRESSRLGVKPETCCSALITPIWCVPQPLGHQDAPARVLLVIFVRKPVINIARREDNKQQAAGDKLIEGFI